MSADNYHLVRRHPNGGYAVAMGFASDDILPAVTDKNEKFDTIEDALMWAADEYAEYGVDIHPECYDGIAEVVTPKAYSELGQWAFSNGQVQEHEADWASDGLIMLSEIIAESRGELRTKYGYDGLLASNSGAEEYENDTFALRPYCWCDGDQPGHETGCPPNFEHKPSGLRISWYKHAGRGITANQTAPTAICWWSILNECVESITPAEPAGRGVLLEHTNNVLICHSADNCEGEICSLHNRTDHRLRHLPQNWRGDRYLMERLCEHGVGHPDPDDYMILTARDSGIHGCDGCCRP